VCEEDGDDKIKKKKIMKGSKPHDFVMISTWTQVEMTLESFEHIMILST
jgi:hypothetical protein